MATAAAMVYPWERVHQASAKGVAAAAVGEKTCLDDDQVGQFDQPIDAGLTLLVAGAEQGQLPPGGIQGGERSHGRGIAQTRQGRAPAARCGGR